MWPAFLCPRRALIHGIDHAGNKKDEGFGQYLLEYTSMFEAEYPCISALAEFLNVPFLPRTEVAEVADPMIEV
jgi:hypothetical protein